jgi:hypothetical protein
MAENSNFYDIDDILLGDECVPVTFLNDALDMEHLSPSGAEIVFMSLVYLKNFFARLRKEQPFRRLYGWLNLYRLMKLLSFNFHLRWIQSCKII